MRDFHFPGRSVARANRHMVATAHPVASFAALQILEAGGNAFDAAICAAAVLAVVEPQASGVGGDSFALGFSASSRWIVAMNGSGRSGSGISADDLRRRGMETMPLRGPLSVTCPGAVDAWFQLHRDHGRFEWGRLFEPAIRLATDGYRVADRVHLDWFTFRDALAEDSHTASIFLPGGTPPAVGGLHRQERLGLTMKEIADKGRDGFYRGWVADDIVGTFARVGTGITREDFENTAALYTVAESIDYRGHQVLQMPANNQGSTALLLLNIMKHLPATEGFCAERVHFLLEASRLAYRERDRWLGDPAFSDIESWRFTDDALAAELARMIDPDAKNKSFAEPATSKSDTTTISVVDGFGNAVTLINSLYYHFGSCIAAPASGVVLQNRGSGFNLVRGHPNEYAPSKRPLHTIMPGLVLKDGRPLLAYGVMGGDYQAIGHVQLLTSILDFGLDIQEAIDLPRAFYFKGFAEVERSMPSHIVEGLARRGHSIQVPNLAIGGAQAILVDPASGQLTGGSDPRKDGIAIGV